MIISKPQVRRFIFGCRFHVHSSAATGNHTISPDVVRTAGVGAVVSAVTVMAESPLPELICGGLKLHVVNIGAPEHEKVTLPGNVPPVGETSSE